MKVYLASWGNPLEWSNAKYRHGPVGVAYYSYTTLPFMMREYGVDKAIIIALDSVITARSRSPNEKALDCAKQVGLNVKDNLISPGEVKDYNEWVGLVNRYVTCVAVKSMGIDSAGNINVAVVPYVGVREGVRYGAGSNVEPGVYLTYALARLLDILSEAPRAIEESPTAPTAQSTALTQASGLKDVKELIVDITHGINYMPLLTVELAKMLASLALALNGFKAGYAVDVRIFNAVEVGTEDNVRVFDVRNIGELRMGRYYLDPIITAIRTNAKSLDQNELAVIGSLMMNAPVALIQSCRELIKADEASWVLANLTYGELLKAINVSKSGGSYTITFTKYVKPEVAYAKLFTRCLCASLLDWLKSEKLLGNYMPADRLKEAIAPYFEKVSKASEVIIRDTFDSLRSILSRRVAPRQRQVGAAVSVKCYRYILRNFMAHAGFYMDPEPWLDVKVDLNVEVGYYKNWDLVKRFIIDCLTRQLLT
jgi:CRISPR-associated DxTHG motif protein